MCERRTRTVYGSECGSANLMSAPKAGRRGRLEVLRLARLGGEDAMKRKRFAEAQIVGVLHEAAPGTSVRELCRRHGGTETMF